MSLLTSVIQLDLGFMANLLELRLYSFSDSYTSPGASIFLHIPISTVSPGSCESGPRGARPRGALAQARARALAHACARGFNGSTISSVWRIQEVAGKQESM